MKIKIELASFACFVLVFAVIVCFVDGIKTYFNYDIVWGVMGFLTGPYIVGYFRKKLSDRMEKQS